MFCKICGGKARQGNTCDACDRDDFRTASDRNGDEYFYVHKKWSGAELQMELEKYKEGRTTNFAKEQ